MMSKVMLKRICLLIAVLILPGGLLLMTLHAGRQLIKWRKDA